jgi:hypothetical protein
MEKEWKVRQALYHKLNNEHTDDLKKFKVEFSKDIIENAIKYFNDKDLGFVYPAKSYVVAICYAYWLSKDFNENFYELLRDKDLLFNNDPYFKTYDNDREVYDNIIKRVFPLNENKGIVLDIKKYYTSEFLI